MNSRAWSTNCAIRSLVLTQFVAELSCLRIRGFARVELRFDCGQFLLAVREALQLPRRAPGFAIDVIEPLLERVEEGLLLLNHGQLRGHSVNARRQAIDRHAELRQGLTLLSRAPRAAPRSARDRTAPSRGAHQACPSRSS